ncbi:flagellar basal-body MS-ring/collar protein FliF [Acetoanaerobium sticklandii]|uniref:flagellar basal-body MS-ring/collar protein FliF n=1 Tax=Acetoanaerobium sticklandii TaxID=1511 RepID=UPI003A95316B
MDFFNDIKDKTGKLSEKYSNKQKIMLGGLAVGLVVITTAMIFYFTRPNYVTLYRDIDLKTASEVTSQLDELKIPYRLNQDNSISVPDTYINKAKVDLAGAGLPEATFDYNDLINRNSMFMSDDEKNQARNYALQNEIANVIQSIPGVKKAFVNLSIPKTQEFILQENKIDAKASVFLNLDDKISLDQTSIQGITMLVANSVEGLKPENVTVHGPNGQVLNEDSTDTNNTLVSQTNLELQNKVKLDVEKSLNNFLAPIYGYGNVSVMASVKLNFDTDNTQSKSFAPPIEGETDGLVRSLQENIEKVENSQEAVGNPGVDANAEEEVVDYATLDPNALNSNYDKNERIVNYELNEIVKTVEKAKGQIENLTVAVVLNKDSLEGGELTEEQRTEIASLINAATGLETKSVEIYAQSFNQDIQNALSDTAGQEGIPIWMWIAFAVIALIPILAIGIYMIMKRRKEKKKEAEKLLEIPQESAISKAAVEQIELEIKESGRKKSIESLIDTNPEIVTQLLKTWLDED